MDKDDFALLKVMASNIETIKEELREMKDSIKNKVDMSDFVTIKQDVDDLKKSKWFVMGVSGAVSFFISHFWK
jgi:hypothetical protein